MGVLNVTPDSFSDGGRYFDSAAAVAHAKEIEKDGADIIDIGAASTAPGAPMIKSDEEIARLAPVLDAVVQNVKVPVSVDTVSPETAEYALKHGAAIVNDVSSIFSPEMAAVVKKYDAGWIITCGGSSDVSKVGKRDIVGEMRSFFGSMLSAARLCGIPEKNICLDIGIGFGKSRAEDAILLDRIEAVRTGGCMVLVGASRKRFIGELTGESEPQKRDYGTVAAHTAAIASGADIIRAHNVYAAVQGARTADAVCRRQQASTGQDKIIIDNLKIFAFHGVNAEEKQLGQDFVIDLEVSADISAACDTDDINSTVNYASLVKCIRRTLTEDKYNLIEKAAQQISCAVFAEFPSISRLKLTLKKPDAPIKADFGFVAVQLERSRNSRKESEI